MSEDPLRVALIIGSTREGRFAPVVARWFADRAAVRSDIVLDVIDLLDVDVPSAFTFDHSATVRDYVERIGLADAFVVVTPEYNHGYPAALKQAIDLVREQWKAKPVGFVSYGGISGGLRAVEQLRQVFAEVHVATMRDTVSFPFAHATFDESGQPRLSEGPDLAAETMLDQLVWWGSALRTARLADLRRAQAA